MLIAIAGNIGSGKTTLAQLLARHYGWEALYENPDDNPYLYDFYQDMQKWAFHLQISFLGKRFRQMVEVQKGSANIVQDRTVFEDARVFASNLYDMRIMPRHDYDTYMAIYSLIETLAPPPDLLIYLKASVPTLLDHIRLRGREYEAAIRADYLEKLNEKYETWISGYPHRSIVVNVDSANFVKDAERLGEVIAQIDAALQSVPHRGSQSRQPHNL